ncbi:hypothetical protein NIES2104_08130 [Leptolyngbya sp. NIES-2104]|nr:hypothetical protein NIES2104_08130 [Leptolyngbya sp. NIES-2104]
MPESNLSAQVQRHRLGFGVAVKGHPLVNLRCKRYTNKKEIYAAQGAMGQCS